MTESAVDHEHPSSIAERFADGFMHPGLEHDAERLAKGYMALEAQNDRLRELLQRIYDNERVWRVLPNSIAAEMFAEMNVEILDSNPTSSSESGKQPPEQIGAAPGGSLSSEGAMSEKAAPDSEARGCP